MAAGEMAPVWTHAMALDFLVMHIIFLHRKQGIVSGEEAERQHMSDEEVHTSADAARGSRCNARYLCSVGDDMVGHVAVVLRRRNVTFPIF